MKNTPEGRYLRYVDLLAVYKALGDDTRFALYLHLAKATEPQSAAQLAAQLGLHPNTVRPHLERLREAGLLEVEAFRLGTVGRPQLRFSLRPEAPWPAPDHSVQALLAGLLAALAERLGADGGDAAHLGREWGRQAAQRDRSHRCRLGGPERTTVDGRPLPERGERCLEALVEQLDRLGFEPSAELVPAVVPGQEGRRSTVRVGFLDCPFRELAEAYPDLVCHLHRGIVEGFVGELGGGSVDAFATLSDRDPCNVTVAVG